MKGERAVSVMVSAIGATLRGFVLCILIVATVIIFLPGDDELAVGGVVYVTHMNVGTKLFALWERQLL